MNLILGRQGTGKSTVIYNQIKACLDNGEDTLLLVVPEQYTLEAEKSLIQSLGISGMLHVEVISFTTLIQRLLEETGGSTRIPLTSTGKQMVVQKVINDNKEFLTTYRGVSNKSGLIEGIQSVLSEMNKKDISGEHLQKFIQDDKFQYDLLKNKLNDIKLIGDEYHRWLGSDYFDGETVINYVIKNMGESLFIENAKIWIDGFHTFTNQMYRFINGLYENCVELTIALTHPINELCRDKDIFAINFMTKEKIIDIVGEGIKEIHCYVKPKEKSNEIMFLEKNFFAYPPEHYQEEIKDVLIKEYKNIYSEIDGLCSHLLEMVIKDNYRWKDICVLTNNLSTYEFLIKNNMSEYGIPCFIDTKRNISDKPLSIFVINTLKTILYNYRYEDIFGLIKTGLMDDDEFEILENYVLQYGVKGFQWKNRFYKLRETDPYDLERLNLLREKIITPIESLEDTIHGDMTYRSLSLALYKYIDNLNIYGKISEQIQSFKEQQLFEYAEEFAQIYNHIIGILDEMVEIFGDEPVTLKEYLRIFETGIHSIELAIIPSTQDQVFVGDITRSRNSNVKITYILGANEGVLPAPVGDNSIFTQLENMILSKGGVELLENADYQGIQEKYLLYNAMAKGNKKLVFSYPLADYNGNPLKPSVYIDRLTTILPHIIAWCQDELKPVLSAKGSFKHLITYLRNYIKQGTEDEMMDWQEAYKWYVKQETYRDNINSVTEALNYSSSPRNLEKGLIRQIYGDEIKTSITRLESFIQCPFKHFITYGLKLKSREMYQISMPDIGELLHLAINTYSIELEKRGIEFKDADESLIGNLCSRIMDDIVDEYRNGIFQANPSYGYLKKYLNRLLYRTVLTLTYQYNRGNFNIYASEIFFGERSQVPGIVIELTNEQKLIIEGRIDRVDILNKDGKYYLKILDFKTGDKELSLCDIYNGISLQLMVYMWVCLNYGSLNSWDAIPAGVFYFKIDDPLILNDNDESEAIQNKITKNLRLQGIMLKDKDLYKEIDRDYKENSVLNYKINKDGNFSSGSKGLMDEKAMYQFINHVQGLIKDAGENIINGDIRVHPIKTKKWEACGFCQYKTICLFDPEMPGNDYNRKYDYGEEHIMKLLNKEAQDIDYTSENELISKEDENDHHLD